jgi:branched-chain amino acid aminotransferase
MADREGFIWLDGSLTPWREAQTHVLTHALHYGSAVFEGERIYEGRVFRLAAHSARLIRSAQLLDYDLPWQREEIDAATRAVVQANHLSSGYVRPIAWRGSEVMGVSAVGTSVHLAIAPWAQEGRLSVQAKPGGISVTMARYRRPSADVAPGEAKVAGLYIICGIEKDRALKAGFDDALMLDWQGRLAESTGANVFLVIGGKLVTPKPDNFLDGITRRAVMRLAEKRGWPVEERAVMPQELDDASEVFLCGTAAEIVPVGSIDHRAYQIGPITRTLVTDFKELVRQPDCEGFGESDHLAAADRRAPTRGHSANRRAVG